MMQVCVQLAKQVKMVTISATNLVQQIVWIARVILAQVYAASVDKDIQVINVV